MRHAGMHWPAMAERPSRQAITSLPGVQDGVLVILADSARFHYDAIRTEAPNCIVVWRALPASTCSQHTWIGTPTGSPMSASISGTSSRTAGWSGSRRSTSCSSPGRAARSRLPALA